MEIWTSRDRPPLAGRRGSHDPDALEQRFLLLALQLAKAPGERRAFWRPKLRLWFPTPIPLQRSRLGRLYMKRRSAALLRKIDPTRMVILSSALPSSRTILVGAVLCREDKAPEAMVRLREAGAPNGASENEE